MSLTPAALPFARSVLSHVPNALVARQSDTFSTDYNNALKDMTNAVLNMVSDQPTCAPAISLEYSTVSECKPSFEYTTRNTDRCGLQEAEALRRSDSITCYCESMEDQNMEDLYECYGKLCEGNEESIKAARNATEVNTKNAIDKCWKLRDAAVKEFGEAKGNVKSSAERIGVKGVLVLGLLAFPVAQVLF